MDIENLMVVIIDLAHKKFGINEETVDCDIISIGTYCGDSEDSKTGTEWSVWLERPTKKTRKNFTGEDNGIGHGDIAEMENWFENRAETLEEALNLLHDNLEGASFTRAKNNRFMPQSED